MSAVFLGQYFFHRLRLLSHVPLNTFAIANFVVERYEGCLNCLFWFRSFGILFVFSAFLKIFLGVQTWASAIPNWCHQRNATLSYRTGTTNLSLMKKKPLFYIVRSLLLPVLLANDWRSSLLQRSPNWSIKLASTEILNFQLSSVY